MNKIYKVGYWYTIPSDEDNTNFCAIFNTTNKLKAEIVLNFIKQEKIQTTLKNTIFRSEELNLEWTIEESNFDEFESSFNFILVDNFNKFLEELKIKG